MLSFDFPATKKPSKAGLFLLRFFISKRKERLGLTETCSLLASTWFARR